jgi:hypothetical protein
MRWIVLAKLPPEDLKSDPTFSWAMEATFYQVNEEEDERELLWAVSILHRHWEDPLNPQSPPDMHRCKLTNREEVQQNNARPDYGCDKCGKRVPKNVVQEKMDRQRSLKGIDPRNNRRGAVLATRDSNLINTKES